MSHRGGFQILKNDLQKRPFDNVQTTAFIFFEIQKQRCVAFRDGIPILYPRYLKSLNTQKEQREKPLTMSPAFAASKAAAAATAAAATSGGSSSSSSTLMIRKAYRELARIIQQMPGDASRHASSMQELRSKFRAPLEGKENEEELLQARLKQAFDRVAFLRIITVKSKPREGDAGRWVYKNGQRLNINDAAGDDAATVTLRQGHRVVSNWDGKNLDPESVSHHRKNLHRAGFVNNLHAKGLF
jgi:hypothetical protein